MRRTALFVLSITCFPAITLAAQEPGAANRIAAAVSWLADDARAGRGVGTAGLDTTAAWLARRFAQIGLEQAADAPRFLQPFVLDPTAPAAAHSGVGGARIANVVGILAGRGPLAGEAVVVGAHYDHLGLGGAGSLDPDSTGVVHNGADDNASGTAALLEIARSLRQRGPADRRTIVVVAFTAEELGLIGSEHYAQHPVHPLEQTVAMVNLDMVGRLRDGRLLVFGTETAPEFPALLDSMNAPYGLTILGSGDGWGRSDHASFYARDIPVLHFFTDTHEEYHRVSDDADHINAEGIATVAALAADVVWQLATRQSPPTLVSIPAPAPVSYGGEGGASLGTIPDMSSSPGGVRLTGVRDGSPADVAGIRSGDIIVRIGEHEVPDLYAMTRALGAHRPGDEVEIEVLRDGARLTLRATLARRGG